MELYFCDLCNESVPQADLDAGRAFMRKGRVVCATCDQIMSQRESAAAGGPFGGGDLHGRGSGAAGESIPAATAAVGGMGSSGAMGGGVAAPALPATAPSYPGVPHAPHVHARPAHSSSATPLAVIAILVSIGGIAMLYDRGMERYEALSRRIDTVQTAQHDADNEDAGRASELQRRIDGVPLRIEQRMEEERKASLQAVAQSEQKTREALAPLALFEARFTALNDKLNQLEIASQELPALRSRTSEVADAIAALRIDFESMAKSAAAAAASAPGAGGAATPGAAAPGAQPQAAWMGLVKQLESTNAGDRWTAVQSLGETRDPAVAEYLLPRLKDSDIFVRMATARVLGDLGSNKAIGALIEAMEDPETPVREAAYVALCTVSKRNLPFDALAEPAERARKIRAWQDWWKKAKDELGGT